MTQAKQKILSFLIVFSFLFGLFFINSVSAGGLLKSQEGFGAGGSEAIASSFGVSGSDPQDIRITVGKLIRVFLGFLGVIFLVLVIYAGFLWMTAGGNEQKVEESKKYLSRSVVGLFIILAAYSITGMILCYAIKTAVGSLWSCIF